MNQTPANDTLADALAAEQAEAQAEPAAPRRKLNPDPKRGYRITMTIDNAPGPFASVEGVAQYDVENYHACGKINPHTGTAYRMPSMEVFELKKVSEREYQGTIHTDLMVDEDYYGRGICRWKFTAVEVQLKASGAAAETGFLPDMKDEQVLAQQSVTKYFWSRNYPKVDTYDNFPDYGNSSLDKVPDDKRDEFFALTLSATEAQP